MLRSVRWQSFTDVSRQRIGPIFEGQEAQEVTLEDGTDTLTRNVGKGLLLDAAWYPRRAQISLTSRRKPEITVNLFSLYDAA
jgi:hypothetical protein